MIFCGDVFEHECLEINTLAELKAYALGGTGVICISFVEHNPFTGEAVHPVIKSIETLREDSDEIEK